MSASKTENHREIQRREHGGVPAGKGGKDRCSGDDEPHLIPIPKRADGINACAPLIFSPSDDPMQHPDAKVEPLEYEIRPNKWQSI